MALTENRTLDVNLWGAKPIDYVVTSGETIYQHAWVAIVAATGAASAASDSTATRTAMLAVGTPDGGQFPIVGDGSKRVGLVTNVLVKAPTNNVVQADHGDAVYAEDDELVTDVATLGPQIGTIVQFVDSDTAWIWVGGATMADAT